MIRIRWFIRKCKAEWYKFRHPQYEYQYFNGIPRIADPYKIMMEAAIDNITKRVLETPWDLRSQDND